MNPHSNHERFAPTALRRLAAAAVPVFLAGCGGSEYDTPTPESVMVVAGTMVENGDADQLPSLIEIAPRDIEFEDGVTEASAIAEVKEKLSELLGRLWLVGEELQRQFPDETLDTLDTAITDELLVTLLVVLFMVVNLGASLLIAALLPLAVLFTFICMKVVGIDANIVALSGIAIAIGTMVDMGIARARSALR